jgi:hypothetical protein
MHLRILSCTSECAGDLIYYEWICEEAWLVASVNDDGASTMVTTFLVSQANRNLGRENPIDYSLFVSEEASRLPGICLASSTVLG